MTWPDTVHVFLGVLCYIALLVTSQENRVYQQSRMHPPLMTVQPGRETVFKSGERVQLACVASGSPQPSYRWEKDGQDLDMAGVTQVAGVGTLVFPDPHAKHEGVYQCFASNQLGTSVSIKTVLREARLSLFEDAKFKVHQVVVGSPLTLQCTPPTSYPPSTVYWGEYTPGGTLRPLMMSHRVAQDYEGNLHIADIEVGDSLNGANYTCIVKNKEMGSIVHGNEQQILPSSTAGTPQHRDPKLVWNSETPTTALVGSKQKLMCIFSGYPTPRVTWSRPEVPMPEKTHETSYGLELTIPFVEETDAGSYCCAASNVPTIWHDKKCINLTVEAEPKWTQMPKNMEAEEGQDVTFHCEAAGSPPPEVHWAINGVPLQDLPDDPRRVAKETTLSFANLTKPDTQVIQCNASNKHGYVFTNAYLNVAEEPLAEAVLTPAPAPWLVVLVCVAAALLIAFIIGAIYWLRTKRRRGRKHTVLEYKPRVQRQNTDEHGAKEYNGLEESMDISYRHSTHSLVA